MKISIIQTDVSYKNKHENINRVTDLLATAKLIGDVVLLPELFSTGYIFNEASEIHELSENYGDSETIESLHLLAKKYNTLIVAGVAESIGGEYFNTVAVVDGNGLKTKYRKISQTTIDKQYFSRGQELITFEHQGITFGIAICFDLWFPEITRKYSELGVDVLLHPSNFGGEQSLQISRARAIENSMYVVTCNRVGADITKTLTGKYRGCSQVCSPSGNYLLRLGDEHTLATIEIDVDVTSQKQVIEVSLREERSVISNLINHTV
ncbi:carbon-nitrogen hydrolase family protein [Photobacterium chitinilyticum]|uniref:Carbon-nitrogen hydrolase family protein n=1 Tax=Photobacterium chitinilyticum TaxID=2485123 RepID=A0A3S4TPV5_9GAMM|nr:carbon-nitrogen hydrolase family protein [Photobacterium chitinilyticum]RWX57293.1 carbon-nitrogen hydrolase family protein [Photobacterium chitinilyticum]